MNSPYLIIDRSGNAVDINSTELPTCHDHYRTCHGCPDRSEGCHGRCEGYQHRVKENEKRNDERRNAVCWVDSGMFEKRLGRLYNEKYRRKP